VPTRATVFVVDDDSDMRQSLKWLIESVGLPVQAFDSAEQFLEGYQPARPGCLLLDVRMPGMGGMRLLEHLQKAGIDLPTIVFTGHGDVPMAVQALKAGAFDFVEKPATHQQILDRVQDALAAERDRRARQSRRHAWETALTHLSQREREVLDGVVEGRSNKVIAMELGISERTVEKHRHSIMQKMGAGSLAELIRMVVLYQMNSGRH
jgi:two-component system response regulator FixJ